MPVGGQVLLGLREATPIPSLYFIGIDSMPGDVKCLRMSACLIMTISQRRKVRFRIGKYLAPSHLASKRQHCDLPASLALMPALLTFPGQMQRKGPPGQGKRRHGKK